MNKIILSLLLIFICLPSFAQDKPWASLVSNNYKVQLNLKNQPISSVARWYSIKSGITIIPDDKLKGNFTLVSPAKIYLKESFEFFESLLNLHNYMLVRENNFLVIKPFYKPVYKYYQPIGPVNYEDQEIIIYHLKNNNADSIAKILNEIFGANNNVR